MGLAELVEDYEKQEAEIASLRENLDRLEGQIDRGWRPYFGFSGYDEAGPSLEQIHQTCVRNREMMALNPHVGNGLELINSYVWGDGIHYEGISGKKQGRGTNVQALIDDPINQSNFFSQLARKQRQTAFYTDGTVMYWGEIEGGTKRLYQCSITDIGDDYRNPENPAEVWAYRRCWVQKDISGNNPQERAEWIFVNQHLDKRNGRKSLMYNNKREPIADKVMFVRRSNPVVGWAYGLSDVQRGISWAEDYRQAMMDGKQMNASMASILATVNSNTKSGATAQALQIGSMTASGAMAHVGQQNAIQTLSTAGQAYDFARLLPLLANFAAGIGVSVIALSMNSGNAGGSYGAAKSLDRPEQLSTQARREYNRSLDMEVLIWLGANPDKLDVWFPPIIDPTEKYRAEQGVAIKLGSGLYEGDEVKQMWAAIDGRDPDRVSPVPEGWLIPNNKESIELRTIDPNVSGTSGASPSQGGKFAPTQGSGASTLKTGQGDQKGDDIRTNREFIDLQDEVRELKGMLSEALRLIKGE